MSLGIVNIQEILEDENKGVFLDEEDIAELKDYLKKSNPEIKNLSEESQVDLLKTVINEIHQKYPRYDKFTLAELAKLLNDEVELLVKNVLGNNDPGEI